MKFTDDDQSKRIPDHFMESPLMPLQIALLIGILAGLLAARASAADFPAPKDLPAKPEWPDPLVMLDGTKVVSKDDWFNKRRPELKALFQHYMYGKLPEPMKISAKVNYED